jgi:hypothetical protein
MEIEVRCPYCGEPISLAIDEGGGSTQRYIEDCSVCCQPMEITAVADPDLPDEYDVHLVRLDD